MASRSTIQDMLQTLGDAGLVPTASLDELRQNLANGSLEPDRLPQFLLERGWLTQFQADRLVNGQLMLGPYVLLDFLGEGGMGEVYKARHTLLDRLVALKVIRHEYVRNSELVLRFQREIKLAALLDHPNIVQVYDADQVAGTLFYTMEYVPGTNLGKLVRTRGRLEPARACEYVCQACQGLCHAHDQGLVHRDIKPSNMMLLADKDVVKVLDLGLAFRPQGPDAEDPEALTGARVALGTADYMAPEQILDSHRVDIRADIYSLGCTLYFLLAGRPPFPGGSHEQKQQRHLQEEPEPIEAVCPDLPPELPGVIRKLMAKKPDDRVQKPGEVLAALQAFRAMPVAGINSVSTKPYDTQDRSEQVRRARWLYGISAFLLAGIALGLFLMWLGKEKPVSRQWIVSRAAAPADNVFASIRAALDRAQPGDRILVRDEDHEEHLEILHGERGRGVTIEGASFSGRPVTWRPQNGSPNDQPLVNLAQVEGFGLKGFVLDGLNRLDNLVRLEGTCPGTQLEKLQLQGFTQVAVRLHGCAGQPQQPVRLLDLHVAPAAESASALAVSGPVARDAEVRGCTFVGPFHRVVQLAAPAQQFRFIHNRFFQAQDGIHFQSFAVDPRLSVSLAVTSNTFHSMANGLRVDAASLVGKSSKLEMTNNLFARTTRLAAAEGEGTISPKSRWVVAPDDLPAGPRFFRTGWAKKTNPAKQVLWELYCDDDFEAWCNGSPVGTSQGCRYYRFDITKQIKDNTGQLEFVAVRCANKNGRAGLLSQVLQDGQLFHWSADGAFLVSHIGNPGWQVPTAIDSNFQACKPLLVVPLQITSSVGNVYDGDAREGNLPLRAQVMSVSFLSLSPALPGQFLRYAETSPLAQAGFQKQPVGVPPVSD